MGELDIIVKEEDIIAPAGYHTSYVGQWLMLLKDDETESMRLTDRTFGDADYDKPGEEPSDIDYWMGEAISRSIDAVIAERGKATVLDVGCGPLNRAAYDISQIYGDKVQIVAVDLCDCEKKLTADNIDRRVGSVLDLPVESGSIDVAYAYQVMVHLPAEQRKPMFEEILRVMNGDSHALIDMFSSHKEWNNWITEYETIGFFMFPLFLHHNGSEICIRNLREAKTAAPGVMDLGMHFNPHVHVRKFGDEENYYKAMNDPYFGIGAPVERKGPQTNMVRI